MAYRVVIAVWKVQFIVLFFSKLRWAKPARLQMPACSTITTSWKICRIWVRVPLHPSRSQPMLQKDPYGGSAGDNCAAFAPSWSSAVVGFWEAIWSCWSWQRWILRPQSTNIVQRMWWSNWHSQGPFHINVLSRNISFAYVILLC